ncbi:MAG: tyrosine-type recombinase/integrase [Desulfosporosinus sp.]|nr:tyrosine-type recombinase/integrase [Desulfosporosinus sp.]
MAGSLEKRGENSWRMVYFKGRDQDGNRIRYTQIFKGSKPQADKALAKFVASIENGLTGDGENMLFRDLCDRWIIEYANEHLSLKALVDYQKIIDQRLKPTFGRLKLHDIKPLNITKFYRELRDPEQRLDGRTEDKNPKSLSGATIQKYHRILSSILSTAVRWQLIATNPCLRVEVPRNEHRETGFYNEEQLSSLFVELEKEPSKFRTLVILAVLTGLRRGELIALTWDDVDFDKGTLTVSKQAQYISPVPSSVKTNTNGGWTQSGFRTGTIYRVRPKLVGYSFDPAYSVFSSASAALSFTGTSSSISPHHPQIAKGQIVSESSSSISTPFSASGLVTASSDGKTLSGVTLTFTCVEKGQGVIVREPKTKSSRRTIALPATAITALREHKKSQAVERLEIADIWKDDNFVFTTWDGTIMHPDTPSSWFNDFLKDHSLPHIRFHDLRHSSATILLGSGVPLKNVSARLGHASSTITANIYAHALETVDRQAADKLDQIMNKGQA